MSALTLADAKARIGQPASDTSKDTLIQSAIDQAESLLATYVGPLSQTTVTERLVSTGGSVRLRKPLVGNSITTAVHVWSSLTLDASQTEVVLGCLSWRYGVGLYPGPWDVTYQAGYSPLPPILYRAIAETVYHFWNQMRAATAARGITTPEAPLESYSLPHRVQEMIQPYLLNGFG